MDYSFVEESGGTVFYVGDEQDSFRVPVVDIFRKYRDEGMTASDVAEEIDPLEQEDVHAAMYYWTSVNGVYEALVEKLEGDTGACSRGEGAAPGDDRDSTDALEEEFRSFVSGREDMDAGNLDMPGSTEISMKEDIGLVWEMEQDIVEVRAGKASGETAYMYYSTGDTEGPRLEFDLERVDDMLEEMVNNVFFAYV